MSQKLSWVYENTDNKTYTISKTIELNYRDVLNYFENRSTNASTESFNAKIKGFRTQLRGVRKEDFLHV